MQLGFAEKRMLSGEEGPLVREAMLFLIELGEVFKAKRMIDIEFAFVYMANQTEGLETGPLSQAYIQDAIERGVRVKVPTVGGLGSVDTDCWEEMKISHAEVERFIKDSEMEARLGILPVGTCTPYLVTDMNKLSLGTHMVTIESSAVPFYNAVLGARVNRGGISGFFAAITGKYPDMGYHVTENRYANIQVDVTTPLKNATDFGALGMYVGEIAGLNTPVFTGIKKATLPELIALSSAIATGGAVSMFHIPGITPEAKDLKSALNGSAPQCVIVFGGNEMASIYARYSGEQGEPIDMVVLGCPHYTIHQVSLISRFLEGKKVAKNVKFIVSMAPQTKFLAGQMGYIKTIIEAGGMVISRTCPILSAGCPGPVFSFTHPEYTSGTVATDSLKFVAYAKSTIAATRTILGNTQDCVQAVLTGRWGRRQ